MYPNSLLFGIIFLVVFLAAIAIGAIIAIKRGLYPALVRLGMIVLCLLLAIPLTSAITSGFSGVIEKILSSMLGNLMNQLGQYSPSTVELIRQFPLALIAPILFILIFLSLRLLSLILFKLIRALLPNTPSALLRVLGGVTGGVTALVCLWAIWIPLWGMIAVTHQAAVPVCEIPADQNAKLRAVIEKVETIDKDILAPAVDNFTVNLFTDRGQSGLYDRLTKFKLNEQQLFLSAEVEQIAHTSIKALTFVGTIPNNFKVTDLNRDHTTALYSLCEDIDSSVLLKNISAEWISSMAQTWKQGETFFGIEDPAAKTAYKPVIHALYTFLATTNANLLVSDIRLFINVLDIAMDHRLLNTSQTDLLNTVGSPAFADDLTAPLNANDRLRSTLAELTVSLTGAWANGSDYEGMAEPKFNATYRAILHACYGFLSSTSEETLTSDIQTISSLSSMLNQKTSAPNILLDDGFLKQFNQFLSENPRFRQHYVIWFASVCNAWSDGQAYDGLDHPVTNELIEPVMGELFDILSTTNEARIHDDLTAMAEIMAILRNYNAYHTAQDAKQMANVLMDSHFAADLNDCLSRHERFAPLRKTVTSLGLSAISSQLTTALPNSEILTNISGSVSKTINSTASESDQTRMKAIENAVDDILTENKINAPGGVSEMISQVIYDEFGKHPSITEKDVHQYLTSVYNYTGDLDHFFK